MDKNEAKELLSFHSARNEDIDKINHQDGMDITAEFLIRVYQKR